MSNRKTYRFTVSGPGYNYTEEVEAVNPPEARRIAENKYGDGGDKVKFFGFNQVYS